MNIYLLLFLKIENLPFDRMVLYCNPMKTEV